MRVLPALCAMAIGGAVMLGSLDMSERAGLESCNQAFHRLIDPPQAASGSIAARFEETLRRYPGGCNIAATDEQSLNAFLGGLLAGFFSYVFFLILGKFLRWCER